MYKSLFQQNFTRIESRVQLAFGAVPRLLNRYLRVVALPVKLSRESRWSMTL